MSIIIRDETANALVLTIDNSGNMYFGDGTPISAVTIAGQEIIDSSSLDRVLLVALSCHNRGFWIL